MENTKPEFSREIEAADIESKPRIERIDATPEECAALAKRFNLLKINLLRAQLNMKREQGGDVLKVAGTLEADIVQSCVITLEPVPAHITAPFEAYFTEKKLPSRNDPDYEIGEADYEPDEIVNGKIDIGELVAQHLSLEMDPYPKSPNADLKEILKSRGLDSDESRSPFDVLKTIKGDDKT